MNNVSVPKHYLVSLVILYRINMSLLVLYVLVAGATNEIGGNRLPFGSEFDHQNWRLPSS